ncbi:MAG: phosphonatase-like hydrolase [Akkermansiaceae bacterium]
MKVEMIVFDMAGTTVDENNVVYKTVRSAINTAGYRFTQEEVQAAGAGKEKSQAIRDVLALDGNAHSEDEVQRIFSDFKTSLSEAYRNLDVDEQPGASEVFLQLKQRGIKVILNTGYDRATAEGLVNKLDWKVGTEIDELITASDVTKGRPHPEMIQLAMSKFNLRDPGRVAKIGDSVIDIEEGKNAGCGYTFGITTGAQSRQQLESIQPTAIVDNLREMLDYLR